MLVMWDFVSEEGIIIKVGKEMAGEEYRFASLDTYSDVWGDKYVGLGMEEVGMSTVP